MEAGRVLRGLHYISVVADQVFNAEVNIKIIDPVAPAKCVSVIS